MCTPRWILLFVCFGWMLHAYSVMPVVIEAESAQLGSQLTTGQDGDLVYVTQLSNNPKTASPGDSLHLYTFTVQFPDTGYYHLYVKMRVGSGAWNDDSFFAARSFGSVPLNDDARWSMINGLAGAGFATYNSMVYEVGDAGTEVWKWVLVSRNFFPSTTDPAPFFVNDATKPYVFHMAHREDGLWFDKIAFGKAPYYYTVKALELVEPGVLELPKPDVTKDYSGPAFAAGMSKFIGNVKASGDDVRFPNYWNQLTPGNEGKWGSVASSMDTTRWNWAPLDRLYNYSKANGMIFKNHTLVWGNQQPAWIESLAPEVQRVYIEHWFRTVGERYPDTDMIDVVNEALHDPPTSVGNGNYAEALGGSGQTGWDWIINSFVLARKYMPNAQLLINDYGIIESDNNTTRYLEIIKLLKQRGLLDGIGVQGHRFELEYAAASTLKKNLDRLAVAGVPIYISEMDLGNPGNEGIPDDAQQLEQYKRIFPILWDHPSVKGITLWGYLENHMWQSTCHLMYSDFSWRPAMKWMIDYIQNSPAHQPGTSIDSPMYVQKNSLHVRLSDADGVVLQVYTMQGRCVETLARITLSMGSHTYDLTGLPSGLYIARLQIGNKTHSIKFVQ